MSSDDDRRLGDRGPIYVSMRAAERYAELRHMRAEEARRELTELLLDARCTRESPTLADAAHYRARSRTSGLDISATVVRDGRLLVVAAINVREHG